MRRLRDFRLVPVVLAAIIALFALKTLGLVLDGGYTLGELGADDASEVTGSIDAPKRTPATATEPITAPPP